MFQKFNTKKVHTSDDRKVSSENNENFFKNVPDNTKDKFLEQQNIFRNQRFLMNYTISRHLLWNLLIALLFLTIAFLFLRRSLFKKS